VSRRASYLIVLNHSALYIYCFNLAQVKISSTRVYCKVDASQAIGSASRPLCVPPTPHTTISTQHSDQRKQPWKRTTTTT